MFKRIFICRNLLVYNEIQELIVQVQDVHGNGLSVTDKLSVEDIALRINDNYRETLQTRKTWESIRIDDVLLTALRDELKRLKKIVTTGEHKKAS